MEYILYISVYDPKLEEMNIIGSSPKNVSSGNNAYQHKVIQSIQCNDNLGFEILNFPSIGSYPFYTNVKFLKSFKWNNNFQYGGCNFIFLRSLTRYFKTKKTIAKAYKKYGKDLRVIVYNPYNPIMKAVSKYEGKIKSTLIVPDLPEFQSLQSKKNPIVSAIQKQKSKKAYSYLNSFDHYILMTDEMSKIVDKNKTYDVIEGITSGEIKEKNEETEIDQDIIKKVGQIPYVLYTGKLTIKYGVLDLVDAFLKIDNPKVNLVICGSGETFDLLTQLSRNNPKIIFLGHVNLDTSNYLQSKAAILVNPRVNSEFTKYSFPSKTIEYLEKKVPVVMHRLHCMPKIYENFIFYTASETKEGLKNAMIEVLNSDQDTINYKTSAGYEYVTKSLSPKIHAYKFLGGSKDV